MDVAVSEWQRFIPFVKSLPGGDARSEVTTAKQFIEHVRALGVMRRITIALEQRAADSLRPIDPSLFSSISNAGECWEDLLRALAGVAPNSNEQPALEAARRAAELPDEGYLTQGSGRAMCSLSLTLGLGPTVVFEGKSYCAPCINMWRHLVRETPPNFLSS